jgi:hypothetical protein
MREMQVEGSSLGVIFAAAEVGEVEEEETGHI